MEDEGPLERKPGSPPGTNRLALMSAAIWPILIRMANRRVLLIDDEDDVREVAQLSLEMVAKWDVVTASSGAAGVALAVSDQPDAIVLDVMMPGMDGSATFSHLQANPATRHIPVVLLTAKILDPVADRFALEVASVISKPFDPMRLPGQIASALGWAAEVAR